MNKSTLLFCAVVITLSSLTISFAQQNFAKGKPDEITSVTWSQISGGTTNGSIMVIAVSSNGDVYAGGAFTTIGGVPANRIAKWNGTTWSALGSGVNASVFAIAISGSDVYVGGNLTTAGSSSANYIAKWDGSTWSTLGTPTNGVNNYVKSISISGSDVYVGGGFTYAGGSSANYIAKWNGSAWSALGTGLNSYVNAISISGSDIYVGGAFTTAGSSSANYIAKWNGSTWSALGSPTNGVSNYVRCISISGSDVYVGGDFGTAGGSPANRIAKWNGSNWIAIDPASPLYSTVIALNWGNGYMYVGGAFCQPIELYDYIAKFSDSGNPFPVELTSFNASVVNNGVILNWQTATEVNNYGFDVERNVISLNSGWEKIGFVDGHGTVNTPQSYSYIDQLTASDMISKSIYYRLKQIDRDGKYEYSSVVNVTPSSAPTTIRLYQNYPNPFGATSITGITTTKINYTLAYPASVTLVVNDMLGREVARLVNDATQDAGIHEVEFNANNIPTGIYLYQLRVGRNVVTKKMVVLR